MRSPRTRYRVPVRGFACAGITLVGASRCTMSLPPNGPGRHSVVTAELPGVGPVHAGCDRAGIAVRSGSANTKPEPRWDLDGPRSGPCGFHLGITWALYSTAARAGHGACEGVLEMGEVPAAFACWRRDR